jgi:hypothetical protein
MSKKLKNILLGIAAVFVIMQLFRIDKTNPPVRQDQDFIVLTQPPENIQQILHTSCYDCHSNQTAYPWYTNVAPISWWIRHHIDEGREHLNFSTWAEYDADEQDHKLEEAVEEIKEGEMPLSSYTIVHREAKLSDTDRRELADWFASLR